MLQSSVVTRRRVVAGGAALSLVAAPFVRSANAAGSLTIGLWDHWVPGANDVQSAIIKDWSDKEKVEVKIDYITSQGNKLLLTLQAEAQAKSGHDIMEFTNWESALMNRRSSRSTTWSSAWSPPMARSIPPSSSTSPRSSA